MPEFLKFVSRLTESEKTLVASLIQRRSSMLELTQKLANINSGSYNNDGIQKCLSILETELSPVCDVLSYQPLDNIESVNEHGEIEYFSPAPMLIGKINPNADFQLLCTGHIDTVFPTNTHFTRTRIEEDRLHGPGVADMKGGLVVLFEAVNAILSVNDSFNIGFTIAISPDEEIGSLSSAAELHKLAQNADYGLTYEPALEDGTLAGARKGSGNFAIHIKGLSTHAGREYFKGNSAINCAAKLTLQLESLSNETSEITCNVGKISGGGPVNIVPDTAVVHFNIRSPDQATEKKLETTLNSIIADLEKETQCVLRLHGKFNRPAKPMCNKLRSMFHLLEECGNDLAIPIAFRDTGGCCEGNNLTASGLHNIDTLGVRGAHIHSDKEFALMDSFVERAQLSALFMSRLFMKHQQGKD